MTLQVKAIHRTKISFVLILVLVLTGALLLQRVKSEKSSEQQKAFLAKDAINKVINGANPTRNKDSEDQSVVSLKGTPLQVSYTSINSKENLVSKDDILELELPGIEDREIDMALYAAQADQICKAQDKIMHTWPPYSDIRDQLDDELLQGFDLENTQSEKLVQMALELRRKFWQGGGNFSKVSYRDGYMARILLELVHRRDPKNMAITDELVETIQSVELSWSWVYEEGSYKKVRNSELAKVLLKLRSAQFDQIKKEVEQGREPTWEDFLRTNDLVLLLGKRKDYESAQEVVKWEIQEADRGEWMSYIEQLEKSLHELSRNNVLEFNIYWAYKSSYPEEYKYARRLPSFTGPNPEKRGVTPIHELNSNPVWKSAQNDHELN
jgi:hypothetical protein